MDKIRKLRNKSNHGFIGRNTGNSDIRNSIDKLEDYFQSSKNLLFSIKEEIKSKNINNMIDKTYKNILGEA